MGKLGMNTRLKIGYPVAAYIPSRWANSIQVTKMSQAFTQVGHDVELIIPSTLLGYNRIDREEIWKHYGISDPFTITQLPLQGLINIERRVRTGRLSFGYAVARHLQKTGADLAFARNYVAPYWTAKLGIATIAETHADVDDFYQKQMVYEASHWPTFKALVTISSKLAEDYARAGVPEEKIIVEQDGVDPSPFIATAPEAVTQLKAELTGKYAKTVLYAGHLYDYKGMPTLLDAAARLPETRFVLVGGWEHDVKRMQDIVDARRLENVTLIGFVPNQQIPAYLMAADLLLLPNSAQHAQAGTTSPLKLFEYMVSGTPIVATSIENVTEILRHRENALLVNPDDPNEMAEGIQFALAASNEASAWANQAREDVAYYAWTERVKRILDFALAADSHSKPTQEGSHAILSA